MIETTLCYIQNIIYASIKELDRSGKFIPTQPFDEKAMTWFGIIDNATTDSSVGRAEDCRC